MGHGHVTPSADGSRARCGGPGICQVCSKELGVFVNEHGRIPDHMVKPTPDEIVIGGVTYTKKDRHPLFDLACKVTQPVQLDLFWLQDMDKSGKNLRHRFPVYFRGFPTVPSEIFPAEDNYPMKDEGCTLARKPAYVEPIQIEAFPEEHLTSPIQFEKQCFQFCGDACDCGKLDFMRSYYEPYEREEAASPDQ